MGMSQLPTYFCARRRILLGICGLIVCLLLMVLMAVVNVHRAADEKETDVQNASLSDSPATDPALTATTPAAADPKPPVFTQVSCTTAGFSVYTGSLIYIDASHPYRDPSRSKPGYFSFLSDMEDLDTAANTDRTLQTQAYLQLQKLATAYKTDCMERKNGLTPQDALKVSGARLADDPLAREDASGYWVVLSSASRTQPVPREKEAVCAWFERHAAVYGYITDTISSKKGSLTLRYVGEGHAAYIMEHFAKPTCTTAMMLASYLELLRTQYAAPQNLGAEATLKFEDRFAVYTVYYVPAAETISLPADQNAYDVFVSGDNAAGYVILLKKK